MEFGRISSYLENKLCFAASYCLASLVLSWCERNIAALQDVR
jgi:hypothetical protein